MSRFIPGIAVIALLLAALAWPRPAAGGIASVEDALAEMTLGSEDAPVTIIEYSSLGCPHCAAFHRDTLPQIKREYIDTGKAKLVYRDFPLGTSALAASMIARCAGPEKYFGFIDILFRSQTQWSRSQNPLAALTRIARFGGMSEADVQACLQAQAILDGIRQGAAYAQQNHNINSTPTFLIDGQVISGAMPYEHFKKAIEKALKK